MLVKNTVGPGALVLPDGTVVEYGETADVPKETAEQLIAQGWKRANQKEKK